MCVWIGICNFLLRRSDAEVPREFKEHAVGAAHHAVGLMENNGTPEDPSHEADWHGDVPAFCKNHMRPENNDDQDCFEDSERKEEGKKDEARRRIHARGNERYARKFVLLQKHPVLLFP